MESVYNATTKTTFPTLPTNVDKHTRIYLYKIIFHFIHIHTLCGTVERLEYKWLSLLKKLKIV